MVIAIIIIAWTVVSFVVGSAFGKICDYADEVEGVQRGWK